MCGIAGIINGYTADIKDILHAMSSTMLHRGPDGHGEYVDDHCAFAHRRLAILDPENGIQPFFSEDGSIVAILNGEIYNFQQLRADLESRGHQFKTRSDAEIIPHLYEEYGSGFVSKLDGMFALAVYSKRNNRLLLARDRMGKKPLFYFMSGATLVFASTLNALKQHPLMPRELDNRAVSDFLSLHYVPCPNTIYRDVHQLPPAYLMEYHLQEQTLSIRGYWHLDYSLKCTMPFPEAVQELRRLTENAVKKRLLSDVPLGCFLSGGVDSTIITGLCAKLRPGEPLDCYSIGVSDSAYDETEHARNAAETIRQQSGAEIRFHTRTIEPDDFRLLEKLSNHSGQPFADASILPSALLCQFAKEEITVALSGDGADEIFAGYERYLALGLAAKADVLPFRLRKMLCWSIACLFPERGERTASGRIRRMLSCMAVPPSQRYLNILDRCPPKHRKNLFGDRLKSVSPNGSSEYFDSLHWELSSTDAIEKFAELDVHSYLPNDILPKLDTASMASSLEIRSPFLDRELVEFAASLPLEYKLNGRSRKHILKVAFDDILPQEIAKRPKKGFGIPISKWLRTGWRSAAEEAIFDGKLSGEEFFSREALRNVWNAHQNQQEDAVYLLWGILHLALFLNGK
jgi:asparagine synthase (glutamine-hydrolysing)